MKPKILVGCPTSNHKGYCLKEYVDSVKNLSYNNYDVLIVDNSETDEYYNKIKSFGVKVIRSKFHENARDRIVESRNLLRNYVLDNNYDYFLSLEQDIIPPRNVIERLLAHKKDVVSGVYFAVNFFKGKNRLMPLVWVDFDEKTKRMFYVDSARLWSNDLFEISASGLGCMLIHKDVLKDTEFRYVKGDEGFDDVWFCKDLREKGIKIYCDTSLKCRHLIKDWSWKGINK